MNSKHQGLKEKVNSKAILKRIFKYGKIYVVGILISVIFAIAGQIFNIIGPQRMGAITNIISDNIQKMENYTFNMTMEGINFIGFKFPTAVVNEIIKLGIILAVIFILGYVFQILQGIIMVVITSKMTKKMRSDLQDKINNLPLAYFDSRSIGDIMSIITNDVDNFSQSMSSSINTVVSSLTAVVGIGIMMFTVSWHLALINVVMIPIALLLMMFTMKISQKYFHRNSKFLGLITGHIEESYTGHDIVKVFNASKKQEDKFNDLNNKIKKSGLLSQFLSGILFPIMNFISNLSYLGVAVLGGVLATQGIIKIGDIQSMVMYSKRFSNPLVMIGQSLTQIQTAMAAADRIFTILDAQEMLPEDKTLSLETKLEGEIEFQHVKFGYTPDNEIIHDFSLKVNNGQRIAIVGPTGAGKTTIVNLLMKFYEINSGEILIDGISIKNITREDIHKNFAMVLQDTWLFQGTIKENLLYNQSNISEEELYRTCKLCHVDHFIESLPQGYDTFIEDDSQVSQGERQLLTIARAMLKQSQILILDEATSNVDTRTEVLIQEAMVELMKNKTSFIIAHRLSTIRNASQILVLNNGDIVEIGNHDELLAKKGFYYNLYKSQFEN
jgi:ATP-binding cassette subfamily B protein